MATVEVEICRIALGLIGNDSGITSLAENSNEARQCQAFYEQSRREALEAFDWPFARGYVKGMSPADYDGIAGYASAFVYPHDALAIRGIARDLRNEPDTEYSMVTVYIAQNPVRLIHTDKAGGTLVYTRDEKNVSFYTPLFVSALALRLASYIAMPLTKDAAKRDAVEKRYEIALERAAVSVGNQGKTALDPSRDPDWITERRS